MAVPSKINKYAFFVVVLYTERAVLVRIEGVVFQYDEKGNGDSKSENCLSFEKTPSFLLDLCNNLSLTVNYRPETRKQQTKISSRSFFFKTHTSRVALG